MSDRCAPSPKPWHQTRWPRRRAPRLRGWRAVTPGRHLPLALAACLVAGLLAACGGSAARPQCPSHASGAVTVVGPWLGSEGDQFTQVLCAFSRSTGIPVGYQGARAVDQTVQLDIQQGAAPDVVIAPSPGILEQYVPGVASGSAVPQQKVTAQPLEALVGQGGAVFGPSWQSLVRNMDPTGRHTYAVVVRASLKSAIWYEPARLDPLLGTTPLPRTWDELNQLDQTLLNQGKSPWCMAMSDTPASGWPGTDWIESILLRQAGPDAYANWVNGDLSWDSPAVRNAWIAWGQIIRGDAGHEDAMIPGGRAAALVSAFSNVNDGLATDCYLVQETSVGGVSGAVAPSATAALSATTTPGTRPAVDYFPFPAFPSGPVALSSTPPQEVAGDLAMLLSDSSSAEALITFLASDQGQRAWLEERDRPAEGDIVNSWSADTHLAPGQPDSPYLLSGVGGPPTNLDQTHAQIAAVLDSGASLCFDASDIMSPELAAEFYRAVLLFVSDPGHYLDNGGANLDTLLRQVDGVAQKTRASETAPRPVFRC